MGKGPEIGGGEYKRKKHNRRWKREITRGNIQMLGTPDVTILPSNVGPDGGKYLSIEHFVLVKRRNNENGQGQTVQNKGGWINKGV